MEVVKLRHVFKEYMLGNHEVQALTDINLSVNAGAFLAIAGPSGSGKSSLLNLIGCIDVPTKGEVIVAGVNIGGKTPDALADLRARTIGFIFQTFNLFPVLTAQENVEYPLLQMSEVSRRQRKERATYFLNVVQLDKFARHRPNQLSGGQRQRVAIARALVTQPKVVLADEPTANLDHKTGQGILALMRAINQKLGTTFIFSTHDQQVIDVADHYIGIEDGRVRLLGLRRQGKWMIIDEWRHKERFDPTKTAIWQVGANAT